MCKLSAKVYCVRVSWYELAAHIIVIWILLEASVNLSKILWQRSKPKAVLKEGELRRCIQKQTSGGYFYQDAFHPLNVRQTLLSLVFNAGGKVHLLAEVIVLLRAGVNSKCYKSLD